jgi:NIMA (never in mitosis gene a)-related kinase
MFLFNKTYAVVKTVLLDNMTEQEQKDSFIESKILEKLDHPNIIRFKEVYTSKKPRLSLYIVMDYADGILEINFRGRFTE